MQRFKHNFPLWLLLIAFISAAAIHHYKRAEEYRWFIESQYHRSFFELTEYVSNIDVILAKSVVVNQSNSMIHLASEIFREAASAKANLGQLPFSNIEMDNTARFLSQVGDYTYQLSLKGLSGQEITSQEKEQLIALSENASILSKALLAMQTDLYKKGFQVGEIVKMDYGQNNVMAMGMDEVEKQFQSYPVLLYDGPYSDHVERQTPRMLESGRVFSQEEAMQRAAEFLGAEKAASLRFIQESGDNVQAFDFECTISKDRQIIISVTKINGLICWSLDNRMVGVPQIDINQARKTAQELFESLGMNDLKETYYEIINNIATINYAWCENATIYYPDLVKVKVAMDNGELLGYEALGYIKNHSENRNLNTVSVSTQEAVYSLSPLLNIENMRFVVIPLENQHEALCYEIKGNYNGKTFLIYINTETGNQEDIKMLIESEQGTLAI